jgi:hypothetical protein
MAKQSSVAKNISRVPTKKSRKTANGVVNLSHLFGDMPMEKVESYSNALLRTIKRELGNAIFFTREDLLHLPLFNHVSTMYRYHLVCIMVRFLARKGDLIIKNRTNVILRGDHEKAYSETPLHYQHYDTISAIITDMPLQTKTTVMDVVALWTTDPHLTVNNKRVAVRGAISGLIRDGLLRKYDEFQFIVRKAS